MAMRLARTVPAALLALGGCATPIDNSALEVEVGQLRREVSSAVQPVLIRDADWRIGADAALFREAFRRINALPLEARTVRLVQAADPSGPILRGGRGRMRWTVALPPGERLWFDTRLLGIAADWSGKLEVRADLVASGQVPLRAMFDPGPGPGIATRVRFDASGRAQLAGSAALTQSAIGKVHYRLLATNPARLSVEVCVRVRIVGKLCRDAELDPSLATALEGDFDLGADTRGTLNLPGQPPLAYRLQISDALLTTTPTGLATQGKAIIEWER